MELCLFYCSDLSSFSGVYSISSLKYAMWTVEDKSMFCILLFIFQYQISSLFYIFHLNFPSLEYWSALSVFPNFQSRDWFPWRLDRKKPPFQWGLLQITDFFFFWWWECVHFCFMLSTIFYYITYSSMYKKVMKDGYVFFDIWLRLRFKSISENKERKRKL